MIAAEWVFPVTSEPLYRHAIEIERGLIRKIRPLRKSERFLHNTCLLPGLVNAHTHLAYTALRNLFNDYSFFAWIRKLTETKYEKLTDRDIVASTKLGIWESLQAGITTVADMSDFESSLKTLSQSPLRGTFYWEVFGVEKEQARKSWNELTETYPRLKGKYATDRLQIGISPHACYTVRPELYEQIAEWAISEQIPISFHVAESKDEEDFIGKRDGFIQHFLQDRAADWKMRGSSSVSHLEKTGIFQTKPLLAHVVHVGSEDVEILSRYDVSIAHCPKSNAKFGHGIAPVRKLMKKGFRIGIGTDSAASNNRFDLFEEGRFALLQQRTREKQMVLAEGEILEMLTIGGARALRMENRIGSLEPGKEADIVALKIPPYYSDPNQILSHLVHNATSFDVAKTIIAGKEVRVPPMDQGVRTIYKKLAAER